MAGRPVLALRPLDASRQKLVLDSAKIVRSCVRGIRGPLKEEAASAAWLALCKAAASWNGDSLQCFYAMAWKYVGGAVKDCFNRQRRERERPRHFCIDDLAPDLGGNDPAFEDADTK